ncbi:hypothetical protein DPMN_057595 [Dreissena polymorpha]|uniref:Uncharacterized protein n=1 Tax=Dreissena polymorpha TaxID=45954 RepID=A0A9D4C088_DREPO|nr:hypothetical protein DPMN_057595 [Dreissena polymorpha]
MQLPEVRYPTLKYFWWDLCEIQGTTRGSCRSGFFDLVIKDTRTNLTGDLNLVGLPWDRIAADLRAIRGLTFDNPAVTYTWIGPVLDGRTDGQRDRRTEGPNYYFPSVFSPNIIFYVIY